MIITYEPNFDNAFLQNFISNSFVAFLNYCTPSAPPPNHHRRTPHSTDLITATAPLLTANSPLLTPASPTPHSHLTASSHPPHSTEPLHHTHLTTTAPPTHHSSLPTHHRLRTFCAEANTRWLLKITPATKQTVII